MAESTIKYDPWNLIRIIPAKGGIIMLKIFLSADGNELSTLGSIAIAVLIFALLIIISTIGDKKKGMNAKQLAFCAVLIALAFVASNLKLFRLPMGGSITLFSMFFITLSGYMYGPSVGLIVGIAYGLLNMLLDPYIISLPQALVDYVFAYGALGVSGFFSNKKNGLIMGYCAAVIGRFVFAVLSGIIFFKTYTPEGMSPLAYSVAYNGSYLLAEALLTIIVLMIPAVRNGLARICIIAKE